MRPTEIPILERNVESNAHYQFENPDIWQITGGGKQPKYPDDNRRTMYLTVTKDMDPKIIDTSFLKYTERLRLVECFVEFGSEPTFEDLTVVVSLPSRMRPMNQCLPYGRNEIPVNLKHCKDTIAYRFYRENYHEIETKDPKVSMGIKKFEVDVLSDPLTITSNSINDWRLKFMVDYIDELQ